MQLKQFYEEEKANLLSEGVAVADDIQVGIMIEIPAAAMLADQFAKEVALHVNWNKRLDPILNGSRPYERASFIPLPTIITHQSFA